MLKCLETCLLEMVSGPLSPLTLLSAASCLMGFWIVRKCGVVSCICACHFHPNVHSMPTASLPGVIKLPFDHAENTFPCCLFAPLFRRLKARQHHHWAHYLAHSCEKLPLISHTSAHHNGFFPLAEMCPCGFGVHHGHSQHQVSSV